MSDSNKNLLFKIISFIPVMIFRIFKFILDIILFVPRTLLGLIFTIIKLAIIVAIIVIVVMYWGDITTYFQGS